MAVCLPYYTPISQQTRRSLYIIINQSPAFRSFTKKGSDGDRCWLESADHGAQTTTAFDRAWQAPVLRLKNKQNKKKETKGFHTAA